MKHKHQQKIKMLCAQYEASKKPIKSTRFKRELEQEIMQ